jgi:hypothetical protein
MRGIALFFVLCTPKKLSLPQEKKDCNENP